MSDIIISKDDINENFSSSKYSYGVYRRSKYSKQAH
jgi:hypothetical protein